jgi:putative nucleotidyltransferase with HDIG domain
MSVDSPYEFKYLIDIFNLFSSAWSLRETKRRAAQLLSKVVGAESASIMLWDPIREAFYFESAVGPVGGKIQQYLVPISVNSIAKLVFQSEKSRIFKSDDPELEPFHMKHLDARLNHQTNNMICALLRVGQEKLGVLQVINKREGEFTEENVKQVEMLSVVIAQAIQLSRQMSEIKLMNDEVLELLLTMIDMKDTYTAGHCKRTAYYADRIADELGLSDAERNQLRMGALLHDIGKIGIPDEVLKKQGKLTEDEQKIMGRHPEIGAKLLSKFHSFLPYAEMVMDHHLRPDGQGYPKLNARTQEQYKPWTDVSLMAKIISVADAVDVMWNGRPYEPRRDETAIRKILSDGINKQFDPLVVGALFGFLDKRKLGKVQENDGNPNPGSPSSSSSENPGSLYLDGGPEDADHPSGENSKT